MRALLIIACCMISLVNCAQDIAIKVKAPERTILVISAHAEGCGVRAIKVSRKTVERGVCCNNDRQNFHAQSTVVITRCTVYQTLWKMSDIDFKRLETKMRTKCLQPHGDTTQVEVFITSKGKTKHFVLTNCSVYGHPNGSQDAFVSVLDDLNCD